MTLIKSIVKSIGKSIYHDPELRKIAARFPKISKFIKNRLTPNEKFGLGITFGFILTAIFIYIFYVILHNYLGQDTIVKTDMSILNFMATNRTPFLNQFMLFTTYLGKGEIIILGMVFVSIILILLRRWFFFYALLISVTIGELFVWIIKNLVDRPRPPTSSALVIENSFSFPSGHTFVALAFYGLLTYFLVRFINKKWLKKLVIFFGTLIVVLISLSRIYLGAHWFSDVVASLASGLAWLSILIMTTKIKNPVPKTPYIQKKKIQSLGILFLLLWIGFVFYFYKTHPLIMTKAPTEEKIIVTGNITESLFKSHSRYSATIFGGEIEPINIIIVGNKVKIEESFGKANWLELDTFNLKNLIRLSKRSFLKQPYQKAPGFPSFWNLKPNELEYNLPTERNSARERYHIHLWLTPFLVANKEVWFGTTHFDKYKDSILPMHVVDSVLDSAREKLKNDLNDTGNIKTFSLVPVVDPLMGKNLLGNKFFTDGQAYLIYLK
jgi:undecaprenyl-diphosphatase